MKTSGALDALDKIFDKKTVKEKQELANLFGEEAYHLVHEISERNGWKEGSPEKIALHALVGGIMSELAGGGFKSGAIGAGFNELVQNELAKITDPALHQLASAIVGAAAAKLVGGDAQTGAATAASGTKNNLYWEYVDKAAALRRANVLPEKAKEIMDAFNNDPLNSYSFGKDAEYQSTYDLGIDENGDGKRLNLFINIAREKGLDEEQIASLVSDFNDQLAAGAKSHSYHIIDSAVNSTAGATMAYEVVAVYDGVKILYRMRYTNVGTARGPSKTIEDIISGSTETTTGNGIARNLDRKGGGGFEQTLRDFEDLNPANVRNISTKYGPGKVGTLSDGTTVVARPGSETGGATKEIVVSNSKVFKVRY